MGLETNLVNVSSSDESFASTDKCIAKWKMMPCPRKLLHSFLLLLGIVSIIVHPHVGQVFFGANCIETDNQLVADVLSVMLHNETRTLHVPSIFEDIVELSMMIASG